MLIAGATETKAESWKGGDGKGGESEEEGAGDSKILMRGAHSEVSQERLEPLHIWKNQCKGSGLSRCGGFAISILKEGVE